MRQGVESGFWFVPRAVNTYLSQTVAAFAADCCTLPRHTPRGGIQITFPNLLRHRTESVRLSCHQNQSFFDIFHKFIQIMNGDLEKE